MGQEMEQELGVKELKGQKVVAYYIGFSQFEVLVAINGKVHCDASLVERCQRHEFLVP